MNANRNFVVKNLASGVFFVEDQQPWVAFPERALHLDRVAAMRLVNTLSSRSGWRGYAAVQHEMLATPVFRAHSRECLCGSCARNRASDE